jgi:hypothetical protein
MTRFLVACAPLRKRFAFVAGDDVKIHLGDLAARYARVVQELWPSENRGRRECRAPGAPAAACAVVESTRVSHHGHTGNTRHSPRNGFTVSFVLFPVIGLFVTVTPEKLASQELDASVEASEPHDFAVRVTRRSSKAHPRPPHPVSRP